MCSEIDLTPMMFRPASLHSAKRAYRSVPDSLCTEYEVRTADGLSLILHRITRNEASLPVVLLHGLTSTGEMFALPEIFNLVRYLLDQGCGDIWIPDWRGSGIYSWHPGTEGGTAYNIDDVALYDIPAILGKVSSTRLGSPINIVAHCIGSMAASMAATAGLMNGVQRMVCANVGLLPYLKGMSWLKALCAADLIDDVLGLDRVPTDAADVDLKGGDGVIQLMANLSASDCPNQTCRLLSFAWGTGDENTLFQHANLRQETHDRLHTLFGPSLLSYLHHIKEMLVNKAVVRQGKRRHRMEEYESLPTNYLNAAGDITIPTLLLAGTENRCWYDSIPRYYAFLREYFPEVPVELRMIDGYGHQDLFLGKDAAADVFPVIAEFLTS